MKRARKFTAAVLAAAMLITQLSLTALANTKPDYLQFPYFDDFESCDDFIVTAKTGSTSGDVSPENTKGALPKAYEGTTISRMANSSWCGTIETYDDGIERMIKSTRNYSSNVNFDVGEFEPGLLSKKFTMEVRIKLEQTYAADGTAVPRVYGELARGTIGLNGNAAEDTIKLFLLVTGKVAVVNKSDGTSLGWLRDPDTNEVFVMAPDKWYTIRCTYDYAETANNLTVELAGERSDGSRIKTSLSTSLAIINDIPAQELTRFRFSHYQSNNDNNKQSVVYYKDLGFYNDAVYDTGSGSIITDARQLPFKDDFESYEPFEAQAQLADTKGTDYSPVMNYGKLPENYKSITMTPSLTDKNRGYIDLAEEENGNKYIRIKVDKAWGRNNIDIGAFAPGVLGSDKIKASFRAKMGETGDTDHPGIMVLLSQAGAGNNNDNLNSVPLFYIWPDRVALFKKPVDNLKSFRSTWDSEDSAVIRMGGLRLTTGAWYDFECDFDFSEQSLSLKITNENTGEITSASSDTMSWCPEDFDPNAMTVFRIRSDARGSRNYLLTAGFDDINISSVPKFKITSDIQGKKNVSPVETKSIRVEFPQIKADVSTIDEESISMNPLPENLSITDVTEDGFTIDLSDSGALLENTEYTLSFNNILSVDGDELSNGRITFTTGEAEKYIMYNDTFEFTRGGNVITSLTSGRVGFSMDAADYSDSPITFAMGLYKKDENGYDTMIKYAEQELPTGERTAISQSFDVPSADGYYIKGYFLSEPLTSFAQDFVFDSSGLRFTERSGSVYERLFYGSDSVSAQDAESAKNICDGDLKTYWESSSGDGSSITVDMGQSETIDFVNLAFCAAEDETMNYKYTISVSEDGNSFENVAAGSTLNRENMKFIQNKFAPVTARYIRISKDNSMDGEMRISYLGLYRTINNQYWAF